jgi:hypothetical protein
MLWDPDLIKHGSWALGVGTQLADHSLIYKHRMFILLLPTGYIRLTVVYKINENMPA